MNKIVNGVANDYEFPMYYESNIKTSRDKDSVVVMTYVNQEKEIENLQQRIDKAIEYIENSDKYDFSKCELLDILKGSDKE